MIVVEVKLVSANTGNTEILGTAIICNDGTGTNKKRNYDVAVGKKPDAQKGLLNKIWKLPLRSGRVENYNAPAYNVWRLVIRALLSSFPEENK